MLNYLSLMELGEQLETVASNNKINEMECILRLTLFQIRKLDEDIYIRSNLNNRGEDDKELTEKEKKEIASYKSTSNELFLNFNGIIIHIIEKEEIGKDDKKENKKKKV